MGTSGWEDVAARMRQDALDQAWVDGLRYCLGPKAKPPVLDGAALDLKIAPDGVGTGYVSWWVPVPLETIVDRGDATPEQIAEYEAQQARRAAMPQFSARRRVRWWRISQGERVRSAIHRRLWGVDHCEEYDR